MLRPSTPRARRGGRLWARIALVAGLVGAALPAPAQEPGGRVLVVLDSSIAMQGALGNEMKLDAAKTALGALIEQYDGRLELGVSVYGARKAKACADVQILSPPGPVKAKKLLRQIGSLKAAGAAPLAQAIAEAATAMGTAGEKDRIVLVAGGGDSCEADPCEAAKAAQTAQGVKIDVVAVRGAGEDLKPLRCIAKLSGGQFYEVSNTGKLVAALDKALALSAAPAVVDESAAAETEAVQPGMELALEPGGLNEVGEEATATTSRLPTDDPENAVTPDGKVPTQFAALLTDPGAPIDTGLTWRVYERKAADDGLHKLVTSSEDAAPKLPLMPGDYLVNVAYGRAYLTRAIKVEPERPARELFVLNAGGLRINALTAAGQPIAAGAIVNEIYSDERDQAGNRALVAAGIKPGVILRLNAGLYHVKSTYGDANGVVQGDISIEAGRLTELTLSHAAANVTLKLVMETGGEALADTQWRILTTDGTLVRESVGALPTHILAPGRYNVEAIRGGEKYAEVFEVEPGIARTVEVVVPPQ